MRLDISRVRRLARAQSKSLSGLLRQARVSRTAFYSLARRPSVLPSTVHALALELGVRATDLLDETVGPPDVRSAKRLRSARSICAAEPAASFENVWHTLLLLDMTPLERLNRSLLRGHTRTVHQ